jgi:prepilin signal peptidase PulO-like enzyme (type II secretory pathway)
MNPSRSNLAILLAICYALTWGIASQYASADRLLASGIIAIPLIWLSVTDIATHEIPDTATLTVALVGAALQWNLHGVGLVFLWTVVLAGTLYAVFHLLGQRYYERNATEAFGIGDAKLIGAGAICVGIDSVWAMILVAASGGIVAALLARRRDATTKGLAFGPFLAYSILVFILFPVSGPFAS